MTPKTKKKEINGEGYFWALLCDEHICGVYPSKKEARGVANSVKDCSARHEIRRCRVRITLDK